MVCGERQRARLTAQTKSQKKTRAHMPEIHKAMFFTSFGVAIVVLLRAMLARTLNPFLGSLKIVWPV